MTAAAAARESAPEARVFREAALAEGVSLCIWRSLLIRRPGRVPSVPQRQHGSAQRGVGHFSLSAKGEVDLLEGDTSPAEMRHFQPKTLGGDKNYDTRDCVADLREPGVTPHMARNTSARRSAIDRR